MQLKYESEKNIVQIQSKIEELDVVKLLVNLMKSWGWDVIKKRKVDTIFIVRLDEAADFDFFASDVDSAKRELRTLGLSVR